MGEANSYCPFLLPPPRWFCFLWVTIFLFLWKKWVNLCEAAAEQKLWCPQNLPTLPAAPVALVLRSSLYLLEVPQSPVTPFGPFDSLQAAGKGKPCTTEEDHTLVALMLRGPGQTPGCIWRWIRERLRLSLLHNSGLTPWVWFDMNCISPALSGLLRALGPNCGL